MGRKEHESVRLASLPKGEKAQLMRTLGGGAHQKQKKQGRKRKKSQPADTLLQLCLPELGKQKEELICCSVVLETATHMLSSEFNKDSLRPRERLPFYLRGEGWDSKPTSKPLLHRTVTGGVWKFSVVSFSNMHCWEAEAEVSGVRVTLRCTTSPRAAWEAQDSESKNKKVKCNMK